jgi:hypothetical protein
MSDPTQSLPTRPAASSRWARPTATSRCTAATDLAAASAARAAAVAREAALLRLCRVSTGFRLGEQVRVYEVREPTPENLATVGQLLRKAYRRCQQTSGIVFVAA